MLTVVYTAYCICMKSCRKVSVGLPYASEKVPICPVLHFIRLLKGMLWYLAPRRAAADPLIAVKWGLHELDVCPAHTDDQCS